MALPRPYELGNAAGKTARQNFCSSLWDFRCELPLPPFDGFRFAVAKTTPCGLLE